MSEPDIETQLSAAASTDVGRGLLWAAYLGASWTWVIGMFLPVLLIRDFGWPAWFVFAIPNVVGAAAMGWALRSPDHSLRFVVNHRTATQVFGLVTIAFHLFFILWKVSTLIGDLPASLVFGAALVVMLPLLVTSLQHTLWACVALGISLVIAALAAGRGSLAWPSGFGSAANQPFDLVALAVICVIGFATCPYLDLTFHRARQACQTPAESKIAFGVGFGVAFCSMIVFTLFYAWAFLTKGGMDGVLGWLIGIHISVQAIFTVGIHASALRATVATPRAHARMTAAMWTAIAIPAIAALAARGFATTQIGPMPIGEVFYRSFMSYYGLIAPAYVWLCVHSGRGFLPPHQRELQMAAIAIAVAAPFYWLGFIHGPMRWALIGAAIVVCARFLLDYTRRDHLAEQRSAMGLEP